jgi:hypothetical protein
VALAVTPSVAAALALLLQTSAAVLRMQPTADPWAGGAPVVSIPRASVPSNVIPPSAPASSAPDVHALVVLAYFDAINRKDYQTAWSLGGSNFDSSFQSFVAGFSDTAHDSVSILGVRGDTVSVRVLAADTDGSVVEFLGQFAVAHGTLVSATVQQVTG